MDCFNLFTLEESLTGVDSPVRLLNLFFYVDQSIVYFCHKQQIKTKEKYIQGAAK